VQKEVPICIFLEVNQKVSENTPLSKPHAQGPALLVLWAGTRVQPSRAASSALALPVHHVAGQSLSWLCTAWRCTRKKSLIHGSVCRKQRFLCLFISH